MSTTKWDGCFFPEINRVNNGKHRPLLPTEKPKAVDVVVKNPDEQSDTRVNGFVYTEPPRIDTISPVSGMPKGGTTVTISGEWFMEGATVTFGGNVAEIVRLSFTKVEVITPLLTTKQPKAVDVVIANPDGQSDTKVDDFVYTESPRIGNILPISGTPAGGTEVAIEGQWFLEGITVKFGDKHATIKQVSTTTIEVATPSLEVEIPTKVDVIVKNPYGQRDKLVDEYIYTEAPRVDTVSPSNGPPDGGTLVTILGQWFMEGATVSLGDSRATITQFSNDGIEILTPSVETEQPHQVDIVVSNPDGKIGRQIHGFIYTRAPRIDNIFPGSGTPQGGTVVKISGQWFFERFDVTFGGEDAEIIRWSATEIQVTTPELVTTEPKKVDVVVKNLYGQSDLRTSAFTYTETPSIDKISPEFSAPEGGILVTITGKWFSDGAKVTFDTVPAKVTQSSTIAIEVLVPPLETDEPKKVDVIVENPNGQNAQRVGGFVYTKAPLIEEISPVIGTSKGGTRVTIAGKWFMEDVAVTFDGNPVETVIWLSYTTLEVITPPLVVENPTSVNVAIINAYGQSDKLIDGFSYTEAPLIEEISPIGGTPKGGTQITISGKWFIDGSIVKIGEDEASEVKVKSDTEIIAVTPPGSLGKKDVVVINPYSQPGALPGGFEYREAPVIQRIQPIVGPLAGNTRLTINGSGFVDGAIVVIGEKEARFATYVSETHLIAITPPSTEGLKDVIIINPDGQQSNLAKFNYVDFPDDIRIYNFPNPFRTGQSTTFRHKGGNGKRVEIKIFNLAGELVQSLSNDGGDSIDWNGRDLEGDKVPPGLYPYVYLLNGKFEQRQLLHVIK